jgi:NAD(P)H dehydrogenase (quinone)
MSDTIFVTGASGQLGQLVIKHLLARGVTRDRIVAGYHENLLRSLPNALKSGQWHTAARGGRTSYVGREDIAEAIAAALVTTTSDSRTYTLTGSEALSTEQIADLARLATGKPLAVVHVSDEQLVTELNAAGVPGVFISLLVSIEAEVRAGNLSIVTDHLESLIGRSPKRLADYLEEAKATYAG